MHTLDEYYEAHLHWSKPKLAELPSHYIRQQIHATFQDDAVGVHNLALTGPDCLLWGNDYPHPESVYPNSNKVLNRLLAGLATDDAVAITSGNAARLFGFAPSVVASAP
jgi:predicted TIM-barrel fold metal-dependent hydrolase